MKTKTKVMEFLGISNEYKITTQSGDVYYFSLEEIMDLDSDKWNTEELKVQQWTGAVDRNKDKVYFGDTLRFADKREWYRKEWAWKFMGKKGIELEKVREEYDNLPFEERIVEGTDCFDWITGGDMSQYGELVKEQYNEEK